MARLAEDIGCENESASEDEFPSLQELVATRGHRVLGKMKATRDGEGGSRVRSPVKRTVGSQGAVGGQEGTAKSAKTQPRKRVLNQRSDNPLLRPFDSASSELFGEESRNKGRGLRGKVGKKVVKSAQEEASGREDEKSNDAMSAQRSAPEIVESVVSEIENLVPVRSSKKDFKTTGIKLELKAREGKAAARSSSKIMKSIEENYSDSVSGNNTRASKGKKVKKSEDGERKEDTEAAMTGSTPLESIVSEDEDVKQAIKPPKSRQARKAAEKPRATPPQRVESEEEEEEFGLDSDGLSDFIVDDSSFMEEEDTVIEEPTPRSVRKLVKGRRPNRIEDSDEELDERMGKLKVEEDASNSLDKALKELNLDDSEDEDLMDTRTRKNDQIPKRHKDDKEQPASSDIEDPFTLR